MGEESKTIEKIVLDMVERFMSGATNNTQKMIYSLFKAAVLSKYLDIGDRELLCGFIEITVLDKTAEACYEQTCVYLRSTNNLSDDEKNSLCKELKINMPHIISVAANILKENGIKIV